jgi:hypothetical protein
LECGACVEYSNWLHKESLTIDSLASHFDSGKLDILLLPNSGIEGIVRVFQRNTKEHGGKYDRFNWRKGIYWSKLCASLLRHTYRILAGEFIDPESGEPHVYHIAANAVMLGELMQTHKHLDDISKKEE